MPSSDEFGKDWYLSRKIALLWWVEPSHFDIVLDYSSLEVTHKIEQAKGGQCSTPLELFLWLISLQASLYCWVFPAVKR